MRRSWSCFSGNLTKEPRPHAGYLTARVIKKGSGKALPLPGGRGDLEPHGDDSRSLKGVQGRTWMKAPDAEPNGSEWSAGPVA